MADQLDLLALPITDKNGNATPYFEDIWYGLIASLGGEGAPPVVQYVYSTQVSTTNSSSQSDDIYTHSVSSSYTTIGNELIQATAACTITLNATPKFLERVSIQPTGNFLVTVLGTINGESSIIIHHAYDLITIEYTELGWLIK